MSITSKYEYQHRWKMVITSFFLQFCSLYAFQDFSSNHDYIKQFFAQEVTGDDFEFYFNVIYSVSLLLLIYFAINAGVICDKYGPSIVMFVQWTVMLTGSVLMCISIQMRLFQILFIGRTLIFMANSTMWISLGTFILQFFPSKEQSLPQAIMTTSILALFFNLNIAPSVVEAKGILFEQIIILVICVLCTLASLVILNIEIQLEKQVQSKRDDKQFILSHFLKELANEYPAAFQYYMSQNFLSLIVSTMVEIVGPAFIASYWGKSPETSGRICALAPLTSVCLVPLGKIADKFQKHTELMTLASFLHIVAMLSMPLNPIPEISFAIYGFAFSIRMMLTFPIQSLLVPKRASGKVYAITRAAKDLFGFAIAFINGIIAKRYGYGPVIYIQAGVSVLVTISAILLHISYKKMIRENDPYLLKLQMLNEEDNLQKNKISISYVDDPKMEEFQASRFINNGDQCVVGFSNNDDNSSNIITNQSLDKINQM